MRISDWSSDVCSSDLEADEESGAAPAAASGKMDRMAEYPGEALKGSRQALSPAPWGYPLPARLSLSAKALPGFGEAIAIGQDRLVDGLIGDQIIELALELPVEPARQIAQRFANLRSEEHTSEL